MQQKLIKIFRFWNNCICFGILKFSLLRTGYFSPVAKVLISILKILDVNNRNFFEYNFLASDQWIL